MWLFCFFNWYIIQINKIKKFLQNSHIDNYKALFFKKVAFLVIFIFLPFFIILEKIRKNFGRYKTTSPPRSVGVGWKTEKNKDAGKWLKKRFFAKKGVFNIFIIILLFFIFCNWIRFCFSFVVVAGSIFSGWKEEKRRKKTRLGDILLHFVEFFAIFCSILLYFVAFFATFAVFLCILLSFMLRGFFY